MRFGVDLLDLDSMICRACCEGAIVRRDEETGKVCQVGHKMADRIKSSHLSFLIDSPYVDMALYVALAPQHSDDHATTYPIVPGCQKCPIDRHTNAGHGNILLRQQLVCALVKA